MKIDERILPIGTLERQFKEPLTEGERYLITYLSKHLPKAEKKEDDWLICAKPQLHWDGYETPDVVIANNNHGIIIFEVKDWDLNLYSQKIIKNKVGVFTGKSKTLYPVERSQEYRDIMIEGIPEIGSEIFQEDTSKQKLIKSVLFFYKSNTELVKKKLSSNIFERQNVIAVGYDVFDDNFSLKKYINNIDKKQKTKLENWTNNFMNWIMPPTHEIDQGEITESNLTKKQKRYVQTKSQTIQKLSGVAGSGKTRVIALRAANLLQEKKSVLVICFNITLVNYLKKQIKKAKLKFKMKNLRVQHFHNFRKRYRIMRDILHMKDDKLLTEKLTEDKKLNYESSKNFDAILIDEGQDFEEHWFKFLKSFLTENEEILFTIDEKQNVYEKEKPNWVGKGNWGILDEGCRIPNKHLDMINQFSKFYLPKFDENPDIKEPEETQLFLFPTDSKFFYEKSKDMDNNKILLDKYIDYFKNKKHHLSDICILTENHPDGIHLKQHLKTTYNDNIKITDIYSTDEEISRQKKFLFSYAPARVEKKLLMSTIYSFKGWETRNVIIFIPNKAKDYLPKLNYLIYTAITRVKDNLVIINNNPYYDNFFNKFKDN